MTRVDSRRAGIPLSPAFQALGPRRRSRITRDIDPANPDTGCALHPLGIGYPFAFGAPSALLHAVGQALPFMTALLASSIDFVDVRTDNFQQFQPDLLIPGVPLILRDKLASAVRTSNPLVHLARPRIPFVVTHEAASSNFRMTVCNATHRLEATGRVSLLPHFTSDRRQTGTIRTSASLLNTAR